MVLKHEVQALKQRAIDECSVDSQQWSRLGTVQAIVDICNDNACKTKLADQIKLAIPQIELKEFIQYLHSKVILVDPTEFSLFRQISKICFELLDIQDANFETLRLLCYHAQKLGTSDDVQRFENILEFLPKETTRPDFNLTKIANYLTIKYNPTEFGNRFISYIQEPDAFSGDEWKNRTFYSSSSVTPYLLNAVEFYLSSRNPLDVQCLIPIFNLCVSEEPTDIYYSALSNNKRESGLVFKVKGDLRPQTFAPVVVKTAIAASAISGSLLATYGLFTLARDSEEKRSLRFLKSRKGQRLSQTDIPHALTASKGLIPARLLLGTRESLISWIENPPVSKTHEFKEIRVPSGIRGRRQWVKVFPNILEVAITDPNTNARRKTAETYRLLKLYPKLAIGI